MRSQVDADQIAAWEWAATRCSQAVSQIVSFAREGDSEYDAVARMRYTGERIIVHMLFASVSRRELLIGLRSPTGRGLPCFVSALSAWRLLNYQRRTRTESRQPLRSDLLGHQTTYP